MNLIRVAIAEPAGGAGVEAFVVISSIDLELAKRRRNRRNLSQRQLVAHSKQIPDVQAFCGAMETGGLVAARELAATASGEPRSIWWCESRQAYEQVLSGIYERLLRSPRPYDAYDYGVCGVLAWIVLWLDC